MVPNYVDPHPDELLYSFIHRLAEWNGFSSVSRFMSGCLGWSSSAGDMGLSYDARHVFYLLYRQAGIDGDPFGVFLSLSTLPFESLSMTRYSLARYVNNVFQPPGRLNPSTRQLFTDVLICPECIKEDAERYGRPYLHRSHHLSGVSVCSRHHVPLLKFTGIRGHECLYDLDDYTEVRSTHAPDDDAAYADFSQALLNLGLVPGADAAYGVILERMAERGYSLEDGYGSFKHDLSAWEHWALWDERESPSLLKKINAREGAPMGSLVPLMMFLKVTPDDISHEAAHEPGPVKRYTCPDCGTVYYAATENGWPCPSCNARTPEQEFFRKAVDTVGVGEYRALSDFKGMAGNVRLIHEPCGMTLDFTARRFLYGGASCPCGREHPPLDMEREIGSFDGFRFISREKGGYVTIRHDECGKTFRIRYDQFVKSPRCRACDPYFDSTDIVRERIRELTGDEYSLIKGCRGLHTPVALRHNTCGREFMCRPDSFFEGIRCPFCTKEDSRYRLERDVWEYGGGQYVLTECPKHGPCVVTDVVSGRSISIGRNILRQEISRPTPSDTLPLDDDFKRTPYWDHMYDLLLEFREETGSVRVPIRKVYKGFSLGPWAAENAEKLKERLLPSFMADALTAAGMSPGYMGLPVISPSAAEQWDFKYGLYERYIAESGSQYVPVRCTYHGVTLGRWIADQRRRRKEGRLTPAREARLLAVDPDFFNDDVVRARGRAAASRHMKARYNETDNE